MPHPWMYGWRGTLAWFVMPSQARRWHAANLRHYDTLGTLATAEMIIALEEQRIVRERMA